MPGKLITIVSLIFALTLSLLSPVYANLNTTTTTTGWTANVANSLETVESGVDLIQIKHGEPYDEKKDPALRRGTENEEMPQSSFFAIPALVIGIMLAFLFFNRDK